MEYLYEFVLGFRAEEVDQGLGCLDGAKAKVEGFAVDGLPAREARRVLGPVDSRQHLVDIGRNEGHWRYYCCCRATGGAMSTFQTGCRCRYWQTTLNR